MRSMMPGFQTSLACLRSSGPSNLRLFASLRMRGKRWLVARGIVFHYLFFFRFVAFALVVFQFAVSGTSSFCPKTNPFSQVPPSLAGDVKVSRRYAWRFRFLLWQFGASH